MLKGFGQAAEAAGPGALRLAEGVPFQLTMDGFVTYIDAVEHGWGADAPDFAQPGQVVRLAYVRDQLGHASIQLTVDTYGHLVPGANRQAVDRLDDAPERPSQAPRREGPSASPE